MHSHPHVHKHVHEHEPVQELAAFLSTAARVAAEAVCGTADSREAPPAPPAPLTSIQPTSTTEGAMPSTTRREDVDHLESLPDPHMNERLPHLSLRNAAYC